MALTEDRVGAALAHLTQHPPDGGHLVRVVNENRVEIVEVRRCGPHEHAGSHVAEETQIHADAEVGMLFDYMRSFRGKRLHCIAALGASPR